MSSNFSNFLTLLMTQLKNQDPSSPLDTNQFTSQLVQFSSVEQQIATNTSLGRLIELTQAGEVTQSAAMIGRRVTAESDRMPLQGGVGLLRFEAPADGKIGISVQTESGVKLRAVEFAAGKGANQWAWDGKDSTGRPMPDGAYRVSVERIDAAGKTTAQPFLVVGSATGVATQNGTVRLRMGDLAVPFGSVRSVGD